MNQLKIIPLLYALFLLGSPQTRGQLITSNLEDSFNFVSLSGEKLIFYMVEDKRYAVVTEGIPFKNLGIDLKNGHLTINIKKEGCKEKKSLVLLYPKGEPVPKVLEAVGEVPIVADMDFYH